MARPDVDHKLSMTPLGWVWLGGLAVVAVVGLFNPWQPDSVELTPAHSHAVFIPAVLVALGMAMASGIVAATQSRNSGPTRVGLTAGLSIMTFFGALLQTIPATDAILQALDFPPARIQTHAADLAVTSGFVSHNHGDSWHVLTAAQAADPTLSQGDYLTISEGDYGFMQSHPGGPVCVHVMLQRAGTATRIVDGRRILPDGSVKLCPKAGR